MNLRSLLLLGLSFVFLYGCRDDLFKSEPISKQFDFANLTEIETLLFDSGADSSVTAIALDDQNNIYILGHFKGVMDGVASQGKDPFLAKLNTEGRVIWKKHLRAGVSGIRSVSEDEITTSLIWSPNDQSVYFYGTTKSSMIENNSSGGTDLFWGKINQNGKVAWVRHFGEESGIDTTKNERASYILMSPDNTEVFLNFDTMGSLFELNANVGTEDIGIMKISPINGKIIRGRQLGANTLAAWGLSQGIAVDGTGAERSPTNNLAYDGNKIVMPFYTSGSLVETNGGALDGAYVVFNKDLTISELKQFGADTWTEGSLALEDQFRQVVVNGPRDYLFYGKTSSNVNEPNQAVDFLFVRYINGEVSHVAHYGQTTLGSRGIGAEEPRGMMKGDDGRIYCVGHTRSNLFETKVGLINPVFFTVDPDGKLESGVQFGLESDGASDVSTRYSLIIPYDFVVKNGRVLGAFSNDPVTSGTSFNSWLWSVKID